jgi:hypothetical protein
MVGNQNNKRDGNLYRFNTDPQIIMREFQSSGQAATVSGIYQVEDHSHFPEREFFIHEGVLLPTCPVCGLKINFQLVRKILHIAEDPDFK